MVTLEHARAFAEEWVDAWNRHDLEIILSHYADPPEHSSPLIVERLARADGTIRRSDELRAYFERGLEGTPPVRFELLDVFPGVSSVAVLYRKSPWQDGRRSDGPRSARQGDTKHGAFPLTRSAHHQQFDRTHENLLGESS